MPTTNRRLNASNGFVLARSAVMGVAQLGFFLARTASAVPLPMPMRTWTRVLHDEEPEAEGSSLVVLYVTSIVLVLLGGAFAGLTIAYVFFYVERNTLTSIPLPRAWLC
jgi:metal transporter CNNM